MRTTKEQISKENSSLMREVNAFNKKDNHLRLEFTKVLSNYYPPNYVFNKQEDMTWEEIFFRVGELNSDANYTILLEQKKLLERKIAEIEKERTEPTIA